MGEVLSKEEWKEMIGMLLDFFSTEGEEHSFSPYQAFQISFSGEEPELLGAPCVIGVDGLCIMPEGSSFPLPKVSHFDREPFRYSLKKDMGRIRPIGEVEKEGEPKRQMWKM